MANFHLVIPMSGQGTRYQAAGYHQPKPLIPVNGIPMIERLLSKMSQSWTCHFILAENHRESGLVEVLQSLRPGSSMHFVEPHKAGPSYAIQSYLKNIPETDPVLVSYCDYGLVWDPQAFEDFVRTSECDACLVSYRGFHAHYLSPQNYAFSRLEGERVVEVREKGNFTDDREQEFASCGAYYFRTRRILEESITFQVEQKLEIKGEFYTSLTVQALLLKNPQAHVRIFEIPGFFQWGTPGDLREYEYWEKAYRSWNVQLAKRHNLKVVDNILMPMAGFGSRFQSLTQKAKPLIELQGKPMFYRALDSLPPSQKTIFVTRQEIVHEIENRPSNSQFIGLDHVPDGQALTTELGLSAIGSGEDIFVSACDHGIVLNMDRWNRFKSKSSCDAVIFVIKGFPGVLRKPLSYSYVSTSSNEEFPLFDAVSVKKPFSARPEEEFLLVGTFWFRDVEVLRSGIRILKEKNIRTNNEIYLDAVFAELKPLGYQTRVFELDGYFNWGDPDSLKEALYWQEIFGGHSLMPRPAFPNVEF